MLFLLSLFACWSPTPAPFTSPPVFDTVEDVLPEVEFSSYQFADPCGLVAVVCPGE